MDSAQFKVKRAVVLCEKLLKTKEI